jgi:hypothetical protein
MSDTIPCGTSQCGRDIHDDGATEIDDSRRAMALPRIALWRALTLTLALSLSACVVPYEYHPPDAFNGTKWGTRIEDVRPQQFLSARAIDEISCGIPVRSEVSRYNDLGEDFAFIGADLSSVQSLWCYRGVATELCGGLVTFESQAFDLHGAPPDTPSTYARVRQELIRRYGKPHRTNEHPQVIVETLEGDRLPNQMRSVRSSWCAVGDPHAPRDCDVSVVLQFDTLLGEGTILYATQPLKEFAEEFQERMPYPVFEYVTLFAYAPRASPLPVPAGCSMAEGWEALNHPFSSVGMCRADDVIGEETLEAGAHRSGEIRFVPPVAGQIFYTQWRGAEDELQKHPSSWKHQAYWSGFIKGLSWRHLGPRAGSLAAHQKWLKAQGATDRFVAEFGTGYQDALKANPHGPAADETALTSPATSPN